MHDKLRRILIRQWPHMIVATRGTAAALAALAAAEFFGLACPYWAAMTALIVIQPTRGLLLEKSFYRLIGTAIGSSAGFLFLLYTKSPIVLTAALCLWVAGCVGLGNLQYGLRSYASLMAGFTCVVIVMIGYQNPNHLNDIAFGRVACIIVGIIIATAVTALFTPRQSRAELMNRLNRVAAESVAWLALLLREGRAANLVRRERDILIEIAELEGLLDITGAGSFRFKKQARYIRSYLTALLSLLGVGRLAGEHLARHNELDRRHEQWRDLLALHLEELAGNLESSASGSCTAGMVAIAAEAKAHLPLLGETLAEIVTSLQKVLTESESMTDAPEGRPKKQSIRHREWREARRAAIRAALSIAAVGVTWSLTNWTQGPMMLIATSIMVSIFSTKEHPAAFVGQIFIGAATGSAIAVFCKVVLLQGVTDPFFASLIIAPFLLIGVFAMTQRRTAVGATDATLFFIFVTQPGISVAVAPYDIVLGAVAMLMGVGSAWLAYRYLIPINPAIRLRFLLRTIMGDLEILSSEESPKIAGKSEARMQHRVVRMVALATRYDSNPLAMVELGVAALATARSIQRRKEVLDKLPVTDVEAIRGTLALLSDLGQRPARAT